MIGVDIVEIRRVEKAWKKFGERFLTRIYTQQELARLKKFQEGRAGPRLIAAELAARFAAKEAVSKALGVGIRKIGAGSRFERASWQEIEVLNLPTGQPMINLLGRTKKIAEAKGIKEIWISLAHEKEYAIAFARAVK